MVEKSERKGEMPLLSTEIPGKIFDHGSCHSHQSGAVGQQKVTLSLVVRSVINKKKYLLPVEWEEYLSGRL